MSSKIHEWVEKYGSLSIVAFVIFDGIGTRDNAIINHALKDLLDLKISMQHIEILSKKEEELFDMEEGTCIQWIFPKINEQKIKKVADLISEGLEFLNLKHKFLFSINKLNDYII